MNLREFATNIIEGSGGMNAFEHHEVVDFGCSDRVAAAEWAIKCLANPRCEGSEEAIAAILAQRELAAQR